VRAALSELASQLETTDRTLRRAFQDGLLHAERPSPRTIDVTLSEREYLLRAWPLLARLRAGLRTEPSVRLAVLFGSRARGDGGDRSDVDILVEVEPATAFWSVQQRLADRLSAEIQLVSVEDAERAPMLFAEVLREGRVLVDREGRWPAFERKRARVELAAARERKRIDAAFAGLFGLEQ
jgi:predicted nucleotidyltransferase